MYYAGITQKTIIKSVSIKGIGLHTNQIIMLKLRPAAIGAGIIFKRTDVLQSESLIQASFDTVSETRLGTVISNQYGHKISTIEHLMSAISACGIENLIVECNGPEVPVMDGSATRFMELIQEAGVKNLGAPKSYIRITKFITVKDGDKFATLSPCDSGFKMKFEINFDSDAIGYQSYECDLSQSLFNTELSSARTFGFAEEVEMLQKVGLARGGSLENAVVIKDNKVMNQEGLRFNNEFVRHKMLDAVGDLALAGAPIIGHYHGYKSGHDLNNKLLHALFESHYNFNLITAPVPAVITTRTKTRAIA